MLDEIKAEIRARELSDAWRESVLLHTKLARYTGATPQVKLSHLGMLAGKDAISCAPLLARMGSIVLGRLGLGGGDVERGDVESAKRFLLLAGKTLAEWTV